MPWFGVLGFLFITSFLLMGLWLEHVRERPVYERPVVLIQPGFSLAFRLARWALFVLGWGLAALAWPRASCLLALALASLWCWKEVMRGRGQRRRMIRRAFEREKSRDPSATDAQILQRILHAMHPRWGEELIEQIAADQGTPEGVADMLVRIERGTLPSGFDPARMLRRR
jgi:hypothetical protein